MLLGLLIPKPNKNSVFDSCKQDPVDIQKQLGVWRAVPKPGIAFRDLFHTLFPVILTPNKIVLSDKTDIIKASHPFIITFS